MFNAPELIQIDKITAARLQIETAIELVFRDGDVVSQINLIHSAWSIIKDLISDKNKNLADEEKIQISRERFLDLHPDRTDDNQVWKELDEPWTVFKHARDDPHSVYSIEPNKGEYTLYSSPQHHRHSGSGPGAAGALKLAHPHRPIPPEQDISRHHHTKIHGPSGAQPACICQTREFPSCVRTQGTGSLWLRV